MLSDKRINELAKEVYVLEEDNVNLRHKLDIVSGEMRMVKSELQDVTKEVIRLNKIINGLSDGLKELIEDELTNFEPLTDSEVSYAEGMAFMGNLITEKINLLVKE